MSVRTKTWAALSLLGATITVGAAMVGTAAPAAAAVGPGEDRQISAPTGWWAYSNISAAQVTSTLNANGARLTDIRVDHTGASPTFSVTEVSNSGAYASGWWWYYDITPSQVVSLAGTDNARATVTNCYVVAGATKCAAIMISNTGANAESWGFWVGTAAFTDSKVVAGTRIVSYSRIQGTSNFARAKKPPSRTKMETHTSATLTRNERRPPPAETRRGRDGVVPAPCGSAALTWCATALGQPPGCWTVRSVPYHFIDIAVSVPSVCICWMMSEIFCTKLVVSSGADLSIATASGS